MTIILTQYLHGTKARFAYFTGCIVHWLRSNKDKASRIYCVPSQGADKLEMTANFTQRFGVPQCQQGSLLKVDHGISIDFCSATVYHLE
jgi:hypothetical protein